MKNRKALVVLSGGQDSTTCLFWAIDKFGKENVSAIGFDYGQRHKLELECADKICKKVGIPYEIVPTPIINQLSANSLTREDIPVEETTDFSGYPDCRDIFVKSLNVTINLAMDYNFVIHTPLMWLNKAETWKMADDLGVLDTIYNETLTCYNGVLGEGCGHCPSCTLRRRGYEQYMEMKKCTK